MVFQMILDMIAASTGVLGCKPRFLGKFLYVWFLKVSFCLDLVSDFIMNGLDSSKDKKLISEPEAVPMMLKITEDKLTGPNYSE